MEEVNPKAQESSHFQSRSNLRFVFVKMKVKVLFLAKPRGLYVRTSILWYITFFFSINVYVVYLYHVINETSVLMLGSFTVASLTNNLPVTSHGAMVHVPEVIHDGFLQFLTLLPPWTTALKEEDRGGCEFVPPSWFQGRDRRLICGPFAHLVCLGVSGASFKE